MSLIQDSKRFQEIASGVYSCILSVAILVGGVWTYHVFYSQHQVEYSRANLEKLNIENAREPNIQVFIDVDQVVEADSKSRLILGSVRAKNFGTSNEYIAVCERPVTISRIVLDSGDGYIFENDQDTYLFSSPGNRIVKMGANPKAESSGSFVFNIDRAGLYIVGFSAGLCERERQLSLKNGLKDDEYASYSVSKLIYIK